MDMLQLAITFAVLSLALTFMMGIMMIKKHNKLKIAKSQLSHENNMYVKYLIDIQDDLIKSGNFISTKKYENIIHRSFRKNIPKEDCFFYLINLHERNKKELFRSNTNLKKIS